MSRLFATLIAVATMSVSTSLLADDGVYTNQGSHHGHNHYDHGHDHWDHPIHTPNLIRLDQLSDRLEKIAEHLHEDAHQLSQDYEHSVSIEGYVDRLDRLQKHMHEILHYQAESGFSSYNAIRHIKSDVAESKALMSRLYGELQHQGYDGARPSDFRAMAHMRQIIAHEAFPLLRSMESELYGFNQVIHNNHRYQTNRQPVRTRSLGWRNFRINF